MTHLAEITSKATTFNNFLFSLKTNLQQRSNVWTLSKSNIASDFFQTFAISIQTLLRTTEVRCQPRKYRTRVGELCQEELICLHNELASEYLCQEEFTCLRREDS